MLARTFLTAERLGLTERQREALITTLGMLERGELKHIHHHEMPGYPHVHLPNGEVGFTGHFNMSYWSYQVGCGTIACLGGTAAMVAGDEGLWGDRSELLECRMNAPLRRLFMLDIVVKYKWGDITTGHAAKALSNYLRNGEAEWDNVLGMQYKISE